MGKLIWSLAEAKLRIMRAAADTHSSAFLQLGENMKDLEDLVRRPDHPASKSFPLLFLSRQERVSKEVWGELMLSRSLPQSPGNERSSKLGSLARRGPDE